jgi:hypothetical protein
MRYCWSAVLILPVLLRITRCCWSTALIQLSRITRCCGVAGCTTHAVNVDTRKLLIARGIICTLRKISGVFFEKKISAKFAPTKARLESNVPYVSGFGELFQSEWFWMKSISDRLFYLTIYSTTLLISNCVTLLIVTCSEITGSENREDVSSLGSRSDDEGKGRKKKPTKSRWRNCWKEALERKKLSRWRNSRCEETLEVKKLSMWRNSPCEETLEGKKLSRWRNSRGEETLEGKKRCTHKHAWEFTWVAFAQGATLPSVHKTN